MIPRLRGAGRRSPRVALAVVPAVLAALLLLAGDRPSTGTSRVEATHGALADLLFGDPPTSTTGAAASPLATGDPAISPATPSDPGAPSPAASTTPAEAVPAPPPAAAVPPSGPVTGTGAATADSSSAPAAASRESATPATATTTTSAAPPAPREESPITTSTTAAPPARPFRSPGVESDVVPLTNQDRNAAGLASLTRNSCLDAVASGYAEQLARSGVLGHNAGAGAAVTECRPGAAWGDNVGTAAPCSAALLEETWMASPGHRHNILTGEFRSIGVGAWTDTAGACWVQVLFSS
jgi:uncharacterized protein YkwD